MLAAEDASRPAGTHTQIPEVVTSDISDYEDKSKYANLVPNTDLKFPETPILPTYSPEPRTPKRVDRLRKLLMKQRAVLQSISSDFCSPVIFFSFWLLADSSPTATAKIERNFFESYYEGERCFLLQELVLLAFSREKG